MINNTLHTNRSKTKNDMRTSINKKATVKKLRRKVKRASKRWGQSSLGKYPLLLAGIAVLLVACLSVFLPGFSPSDLTFTVSLYLSALLTGAIVALYVTKKCHQRLKPVFQKARYSTIKLAFIYPLLLAFIYFQILICCWVTIPYFINVLIGTNTTIAGKAVKRTEPGRGSLLCHYQLRSAYPEELAFHQCIPRAFYETLPPSEIEVAFHVKQSVLGTDLHDIQIKPDSRFPGFESLDPKRRTLRFRLPLGINPTNEAGRTTHCW